MSAKKSQVEKSHNLDSYTKPILLSLDGSAQSRYAAEICWSIAKVNNLEVNAQHVIDSLAAWDFLNFDIAGFIGSGPFFEAHQTMLNCLQSIGEELIEAYEGQAAGNEIPGGTFLDEGTTIREICWRAKEHSFVAIGQRSTGMGSPDEDKRRLPRRSVPETLSYYCPRPLLVVQDRCEPWKKLKVILSSLQVPSSLLSSILDFAKVTNLTAELKFVLVNEGAAPLKSSDTLDNCSEAKKIMDDLTKLVPALSKIETEVIRTNNLNKFWQEDSERDLDSLLVIPVTEIGGTRKTPFGTAPDTILRYLNHPAVLLFMEETSISPDKETVSSASLSTKV